MQNKVRQNNQTENSGNDRQSRERCQPAAEQAEHVENEVISLGPCFKTSIEIGAILNVRVS